MTRSKSTLSWQLEGVSCCHVGLKLLLVVVGCLRFPKRLAGFGALAASGAVERFSKASFRVCTVKPPTSVYWRNASNLCSEVVLMQISAQCVVLLLPELAAELVCCCGARGVVQQTTAARRIEDPYGCMPPRYSSMAECRNHAFYR